MACIYKLVNVANDFFYIGSARNARRRKWEHLSDLKKGVHHCRRLQEAWNEFGEDAFDFEVLEEVDDATVLQVEDVYLQQHAGKAYCYNTATSTTQPPSYSDEVREKIGSSLRAHFANGGVNALKGKTLSAETKAKISASRAGKMAGVKHYRYGKTLSAEVREKIGAAQRGVKKAPRVVSEVGKAKILAAAAAGHYSHGAGKKRPEEVAAKARKSVVAVDPDGVLATFSSIQELRQQLGLPPGTVNNALKAGAPLLKGAYAGWRFAYKGASLGTLPSPPSIPAEFAEYPRNRAAAKAQGAAQYYTGVPCSRGHLSLRATKGTCIECRREDEREATRRKHLQPPPNPDIKQ